MSKHTNAKMSTETNDPRDNPVYDHRYVHAIKAGAFGFLRVLCYFLPGIALAVLIWSLVTGQGIQSSFGAVMGMFTGLISLASIPEFDSRVRYHWSVYQMLADH